MSKIRNIPDNMKPHWECIINGVKYTYVAGAEGEEVPDNVAAVIDNYNAMLPKENPPETDEQMATRVAKGVVTGTVIDMRSYSLSETPVSCPAFPVALFDEIASGKANPPITAIFKIGDIVNTITGYAKHAGEDSTTLTMPLVGISLEGGAESISGLIFNKVTGTVTSVYVALVTTELPTSGE